MPKRLNKDFMVESAKLTATKARGPGLFLNTFSFTCSAFAFLDLRVSHSGI